jgi:hypothetical protein
METHTGIIIYGKQYAQYVLSGKHYKNDKDIKTMWR